MGYSVGVEFSVPAASKVPQRWWLRYDSIDSMVIVVDILALVGTALLGGVAYAHFADSTAGPVDFLALGALFATLFVLLAQVRGLYKPLELLTPLRQIRLSLFMWALVASFLLVLGSALKIEHAVSREVGLVFVACGAVVIGGLRLIWSNFLTRALADGGFATRRIALVGNAADLENGAVARKLACFGLNVVARIGLPSSREDLDDFAGQAMTALRGSNVEDVVVVLKTGGLDLAEAVIGRLRALPLPVRMVLDPELTELVSRPVQRFGNMAAVEMHRGPMTRSQLATKRALDVFIASLALFLVSPLLVMTALAVRLDSPGPILFRQSRNGFNNRSFKILKFRSMRVMEDGKQVRQASRNDARVTRVGQLIRRLSIDELPQLWNVLRGEMSIVGPRPHALVHDAHFEKLIGDYPYRQHVKPGLTGWAQVNGSRGETPTIESMAERVQFDIWYVENSGLWLDLRIIARTFIALLNVKHTY